MSTSLVETAKAPAAAALEPDEARMRGKIWRLLSSLYPEAQRAERRQSPRFPFQRLVYLTPVAADGVTPLGESLAVRGTHLSERGLGFFHARPLEHRLVVASLEKEPGEWLHVLIDVSWCRFRGQGRYESGGRFLRTVHWPCSKPA